MSNQWQNFLAHLQRGGSYGFWCYESAARKPVIKDGLETGETKPHERVSVWWPVDRPVSLPKMVGPHGPRHFWFGVHPCTAIPPTNKLGEPRAPKWVRSQMEYIAAVNCFYAEFDDKDFAGGKEACLAHVQHLKPATSVIIRSGGGYQCYWLYDKPTVLETSESRHAANMRQHAWVRLMGGDNAAKNLNRVLRVVGTKNVKDAYGPDYPTVEFVRCDMDLLYTLDELMTFIRPEWLQEKEYHRSQRTTFDDTAAAAMALGMLSPFRCDDYNHWLAVGMALAPMGTEGLTLWHSWSRGSSKYSESDCDATWKSFDPQKERETGIKKLMGWAEIDDPMRYDALFGRNGHSNGNGASGSNGHYANGHTLVEASAPSHTPETITLQMDPLLRFDGTDDGNAETFKIFHGDEFCYAPAFGWMQWTGTHWANENADAVLYIAIKDILKKRRAAAGLADKPALVKMVQPNHIRITAIANALSKHLRVSPNEFNSEDDLLNVANGVLDLRTGKLTPHSPKGPKFNYCLSTPYIPDADYSKWEDWLADVVEGGMDMVKYLQKAVGYTLTGHTSEEVFWYIWGPTRSGKGTYTEALLELLGSPLSAERGFSTFTRKRDQEANNFDLAGLWPCRLVVASETGAKTWLNSEALKNFTGGSQIDASFKHKDPFQFKVHFKIWTTSNEKPKADPEDHAFWSTRILVVGFPHSHAGKEDKKLKSRMKSPENLRAILAWAVTGAIEWYKVRHAGLGRPEVVDTATRAAQYEIDYVQQWIDENMVLDDSGFIDNETMLSSYTLWCQSHAVESKGQTALSRSLTGKKFNRAVKRDGSKVKRGWMGLRARQSHELIEDDVSAIPF